MIKLESKNSKVEREEGGRGLWAVGTGQYADPTPRYALIICFTSVKPVSFDMKRKYLEFELPRLTKTIVPESCGWQN